MKRIAVLAAAGALALGVATAVPAVADTGNRANCGTVVSGINDMGSRTGSYTVRTYNKACTKRYFQGSYYVYYMPWTQTPNVSIYGVTVGSDATLDSGPFVGVKQTDGLGNVTGVRYDFVIKLKTSGGSDYLRWYLWVYPSGTQMIRMDPNGAVYDSFDNWG